MLTLLSPTRQVSETGQGSAQCLRAHHLQLVRPPNPQRKTCFFFFFFSASDEGNFGKKKTLRASNSSQAHDLPITSSDDLPISYRQETRGSSLPPYRQG